MCKTAESVHLTSNSQSGWLNGSAFRLSGMGWYCIFGTDDKPLQQVNGRYSSHFEVAVGTTIADRPPAQVRTSAH
jgi:hypothetical protein